MIKVHDIEYERIDFPCGEMQVRIKGGEFGEHYNITMEWEKNEDVIELLQVCDALNRLEMRPDTLTLPYVPYSRQDRVAVWGDSLSIAVFAKLINSIGFRTVTIYDPHSDVTPALITNCRVIPQRTMVQRHLQGKRNFYLVSPDTGAVKKIYSLDATVDAVGVVEFNKQRDPTTGEIISVTAPPPMALKSDTFYIVDDICDGGRTFVEIAKVLRKWGAMKIGLIVTHGFFTKGLQVFDGLIDEVYTYKGRLK